MNRRSLLFAAPGAVALLAAGCAMTPDNAAKLGMTKSYLDAAVDAVTASAEVYLDSAQADPKLAPAIRDVLASLEDARKQFDAIQPADIVNARSIANMVLSGLSQVAAMPPIMAVLGPAGPAVVLAIAVVRAFVAALPPPPHAPEQPPAELRRAAARRRVAR